MKQIVVFPRGQLTEKDRKAMSRNGVCVVEADDPSKVVMVIPLAQTICADALLTLAMESLSVDGYSTGMRDAFVKKLTVLLKEGKLTSTRVQEPT